MAIEFISIYTITFLLQLKYSCIDQSEDVWATTSYISIFGYPTKWDHEFPAPLFVHAIIKFSAYVFCWVKEIHVHTHSGLSLWFATSPLIKTEGQTEGTIHQGAWIQENIKWSKWFRAKGLKAPFVGKGRKSMWALVFQFLNFFSNF